MGLKKAMSQPCIDFLARMDGKVVQVVQCVERTDAHRAIIDPTTEKSLLLATIRQILSEVGSYGPHITKASFTAIGRLQGHEKFMGPLVGHLLEEVFHPGMANNESLAGGDYAGRRIRPAALAVAAVCRFLGGHENPFCYLGYMYLLEATTSDLAERYRSALEARGEEIAFVTLHAREDAAHTDFLRKQISQIVSEDADASIAIEYGFDCLASIYPEPIWNAAFRRALDEVKAGRL